MTDEGAELARLRSMVGRYINYVAEQEGIDFLDQTYPPGTFLNLEDGTPEHDTFVALTDLSDGERRELALIAIDVHNTAARFAIERNKAKA